MKYAQLILSLIISFGSLSSCDYNTSYVEGNKNRISETRELESFEDIHITGNFNISFVQNNKHKADLTCSSNIGNYIMSEVQNNTLYISVPENILIKEDKPIDLTIHLKTLNSLTTKGKTKIKTTEKLHAKYLEIECIGSSKLDLNIDANKLNVNLPGASSFNLNGKINDVNIVSSGALQYNANDCEVDFYNITMNGAGNAKVKVNKSLKVQINGAGNLLYTGTPDKVISNIGGIGKVKRSEK
ncbi:DUF2807 domain-containing protein [Labilibacter sediminis]|nr:DUF2807 domain-containing protein [Labilibacter sediminis]